MKSLILLPLFILLAAAVSGCMGGDSGTPKALFTITPKDAQRKAFTFDASASSGGGLSYEWDFGDGTTGNGKTVEHEYTYVNGEYHAQLTVTNAGGKSELALTIVTGTELNQSPVLCLTVDTRRVSPGADVVFDASASFDPDGEPVTFDWGFNYQDPSGAKFEFEDLGHMQYGHSSSACPVAGDMGMSGSGGGSRAASEGAPTVAESLRGLFPGTRDAGHGDEGPHEAYNTEFDGTIDSHDAIQVFKFPSPATYYVLVKVLDPKRDPTLGFIKIMVEENAPAATASSTHSATLHYGTEQAPPLSQVPANKTDSWQFKMTYPGSLALTVRFAADNQEPELDVYLCPASLTAGDCKAAPTKKVAKAKSPIQLTHAFASQAPGSYQALIENVSPTVNVEVNEELSQRYDTNPWYATESGTGGGGHAGH